MIGRTSQVPFFYGRMTSLQNRLNQPSADFCPKILFYAFYGGSPELLAVDRRLYPPTSVLKTKDSSCGWGDLPKFGYKSAYLSTPTSVLKLKILFPNFLRRKGIIFGAKGSGQSFWPFLLLPLFPLVVLLEWPTFPFYVRPVTGHGVQVALVCLFKHRRVGELICLSLSVAYHVRKANGLVWFLCLMAYQRL